MNEKSGLMGAYRNAIGEIYARRAADAVGRSDQELRAKADFVAGIESENGIAGLQSARNLSAACNSNLQTTLKLFSFLIG
jgi:hypothetical protein